MGECDSCTGKDWTAHILLPLNTMLCMTRVLVVTMLVTLSLCLPSPQRKSDAQYMEIYTQCRSQFGTSPTVECKSSQDCSLSASKEWKVLLYLAELLNSGEFSQCVLTLAVRPNHVCCYYVFNYVIPIVIFDLTPDMLVFST